MVVLIEYMVYHERGAVTNIAVDPLPAYGAGRFLM